MKKIGCLLISLCLLAGCAAEPRGSSVPPSSAPAASSQPEKTAGPVTFTDALGREVTVDHPQRVAVMIGSFAEIWCLAGGKDQLVAAAHDSWVSFDLDLDESVADVGNSKESNLEQLLAAEPDFVIASAHTRSNVELLDTFESAGINAAYFQVNTVDEYLDMLHTCTQITGREENYAAYGETVWEQCQKAKERADGTAPTALYIMAAGTSCKAKNSEDTVLGEMLKDLGCINIADSETGLLEDLSLETIVASDPDFIFAVFHGSDREKAQQALDRTLLSNPAWQGLTAVREGRFHVMDEKLYNLKPNARWGEAYLGLAEILYPVS